MTRISSVSKYAPGSMPTSIPVCPLGGVVAVQALAAPAPAIYGGSDQIQRNVIGERVLGLPKEPDVSRDVPFRDLKKGIQGQEARSL